MAKDMNQPSSTLSSQRESKTAQSLARALLILPVLWAIDWFSNHQINWAYWPTLGWLGVIFLRPVCQHITKKLMAIGL